MSTLSNDLHGNALYRWEQGLSTSSWENVVQEDAEGHLIAKSSQQNDLQRSLKSKQSRITQSIRRGIIRYTLLVMDCSQYALENDYRPSRFEICKTIIQSYLQQYFDQNPISQCSLLVTRDRIASELTSLSSNVKHHLHRLQQLIECKGLPSLQNILLLSIAKLRYTPSYVYREVIILYNSISTCDPSDIFKTIEECKRLQIHVHIINLVADVYICHKICEETKGQYMIALHSNHVKECLFQLITPPPELVNPTTSTTSTTSGSNTNALTTDMIYMGFPKRSFDLFPFYSFDGKQIKQQMDAYICPRCNTRHTDIPTLCNVCGLQLYSSSHIARSFHHLFPVPNFTEYIVQWNEKSKQFEAKLLIDLEDSATKATGAKKELPIGQKRTWEEVEVIEIDPKTGQEIKSNQSSQETDDNKANDSDDTKGIRKCIPLLEEQRNLYCIGCLDSIVKEHKIIFLCPSCQQWFCIECDLFIHDALHNCPGC